MGQTKTILRNIELPGITPIKEGKVRSLYDLGDKILFVASDRISAFDHIFAEGIPDKGKVLTSISAFWFVKTKHIVENHFITANIDEYPEDLKKHKDKLAGRSMLVKKAQVLPIECIVRGYIEGSGWKDYKKTGAICGEKLPAGLKQGDKLPQIMFTPSTKADEGHDINISVAEMEKELGKELTKKVINAAISVYKYASETALKNGVIIADTKFEFGLDSNGNLLLIDEILTPDSSRFWDNKFYDPGHAQMSFDKQFVREYLEGINWNKEPPIPHLPEDIIQKTSEKYREAYKRVTGKDLS
ncbi:phosphoribosylaminoimidazolesuccinocarboxamide synthase [Candidatus Margulisiibacteriota bacterium]